MNLYDMIQVHCGCCGKWLETEYDPKVIVQKCGRCDNTIEARMCITPMYARAFALYKKELCTC